jgi:hypothetical protein
MAAKTMSSPVWESIGSLQMISGSISSVSDGDTFDAKGQIGFDIISNAICNPTTAVVVTPTISGTTITFKVASGTPTITLSVLGK